jgi:hypothetical protein
MPDLVNDLLDIADSLVQRDERRPRNASLRRGVSTAYYALFNRLAELCADTLVGWRRPWEVFTPIYRSIDHGRTLVVLTERTSEKKHPLGDEIERVGVTFRALQAAREWADYNPEPHPDPFETLAGRRFSREQAEQLVANAREAVSVIDRLSPDARLTLVTRLIAKQRR